MKQKYSQKDTKKEDSQNETEVWLEDTKKEDSQKDRKTVRYFKRKID